MAKIGFHPDSYREKISPFPEAKQYLKYLTGCEELPEVIKGGKLYPSTSPLFYGDRHLLVDYGAAYKEWLCPKNDQGF